MESVHQLPLTDEPLCRPEHRSGRQGVRREGWKRAIIFAPGVNFEASAEVVAPPVVTAPVAGSTFAWTDSGSLGRSAPTDPDRFEVCLNCWENSLDDARYSVSGSAREFKIAPRALMDYGTGAIVAVYAFNSNFLKSAGSPEVTSNVLFMARSMVSKEPVVFGR